VGVNDYSGRVDTPFYMSRAAYERLHTDAREADMPLLTYFRAKAIELVRIASPRFTVNGKPFLGVVAACIPEATMQGLKELCRDIGVPFETAGELVASADIDKFENYEEHA
jgi:hypothetical protein